MIWGHKAAEISAVERLKLGLLAFWALKMIMPVKIMAIILGRSVMMAIILPSCSHLAASILTLKSPHRLAEGWGISCLDASNFIRQMEGVWATLVKAQCQGKVDSLRWQFSTKETNMWVKQIKYSSHGRIYSDFIFFKDFFFFLICLACPWG